MQASATSIVSEKHLRSQKHPFHILDVSPFPFLTGIFSFFWLVPQVFYLHGLPLFFFPRADIIHASFIGLFLTVMAWFFSIVKESSQGYHTRKVQYGLRLGMLLFILSEVMFFFAFFWSFFHYTLVPSIVVGGVWPPVGTQVLDVWGLPFVNTLLLLTSGVTITIAHAYLIKNNARGFSWYLVLTVILGVTFLFCQAYEYKYGVKFSWRENIYGSIFFITTGFHGLHVTIGTLFLAYCWVRHYFATILPRRCYVENRLSAHMFASALMALVGYQPHTAYRWAFTPDHHFGFEAAAWYWHFVDVVWLFLFITVYWWGGLQ
jgi:cytochrome c oxidase subunit III